MRRFFLTILLLALFSYSVLATFQAPDELIINGKTYDLYSNPLEYYYSEDSRPAFMVKPNSWSSANWRGYITTWEIIEDRLYLTKIDSWFCDSGCRRVTLSDLFGTKVSEGKVAATWFSNELRVPDGKLIEYVHMGYGSIYERDIVFTVDSGKIVKREVIDNTKRALPSNQKLQEKELEKLRKSPLGEKPLF